jgi:hypothetical protein
MLGGRHEQARKALGCALSEGRWRGISGGPAHAHVQSPHERPGLCLCLVCMGIRAAKQVVFADDKLCMQKKLCLNPVHNACADSEMLTCISHMRNLTSIWHCGQESVHVCILRHSVHAADVAEENHAPSVTLSMPQQSTKFLEEAVYFLLNSGSSCSCLLPADSRKRV